MKTRATERRCQEIDNAHKYVMNQKRWKSLSSKNPNLSRQSTDLSWSVCPVLVLSFLFPDVKEYESMKITWDKKAQKKRAWKFKVTYHIWKRWYIKDDFKTPGIIHIYHFSIMIPVPLQMRRKWVTPGYSRVWNRPHEEDYKMIQKLWMGAENARSMIVAQHWWCRTIFAQKAL